MSEVYAFLKECGTFFVVTDNKGFPTCRPFDSLIEIDNELVIGVVKNRDIHRQLKQNSRIQIVSISKDNSKWLRLNGYVLEDNYDGYKKEILNSSNYFKKYNLSKDYISVFKVEVLDYKIYK